MSIHSFKHNPGNSTWMRRVLIAIILVFALGSSLSACRVGKASPEAAPLSLSALEAQYGLRVNLVAVTAAGGMVDVRLKIVDGGKAQVLLQDPNNYPALLLPDNDTTLELSPEARPEEIKFEDNGNLFMMFPNTGNAVKPGVPLTITFGDLRLEPIIAQ